MEVLEVVGRVGGGGHGGDGGGGHFQMANVDYPPNSEPITPITRKKTWARVAATCTTARSVRRSAESLTETCGDQRSAIFRRQRSSCA